MHLCICAHAQQTVVSVIKIYLGLYGSEQKKKIRLMFATAVMSSLLLALTAVSGSPSKEGCCNGICALL